MGPEFDRAEIHKLRGLCQTARGARARGSALEDLTEYIFRQVPSVSLYQRDVCDEFGVQEVDLVFSHLPVISRLPIPDVTIVVECKNERQRASASQVRDYASKLTSRALNIGILITTAGLSGHGGRNAHGAIRDVLAQGTAIIVVTTDELSSLKTPEDVPGILTDRLVELRTYRNYRTV